MKKISIMIFLMMTTSVIASDISLSIRPNIGIQIPSSNILKDYYDRNAIVNYGATGLFINRKLNWGVFLSYTQYHFEADDPSVLSGTEDIRGSLLSFGVQKSIVLKPVTVWGRIGMSKHFDDLEVSNEDDNRIGLCFGLGLDYNLTRRCGVFSEVMYGFERLSVPEYVNCDYSRHQAFLSGKTFNTGGLFIKSGFMITLNP